MQDGSAIKSSKSERESLIEEVSNSCFDKHTKELRIQNEEHEKRIKRAIAIRVTLPVTVLIGLCIWVLGTLYNVGTDNATLKAQNVTTQENLKAIRTEIEKADNAQGQLLQSEIDARREAINSINVRLDALELKVNLNIQQLYQLTKKDP